MYIVKIIFYLTFVSKYMLCCMYNSGEISVLDVCYKEFLCDVLIWTCVNWILKIGSIIIGLRVL